MPRPSARPASSEGSEAAGADEVVFTGDGITDFWSYTQTRDYLLLMPGMTHPALRLYQQLRSMVSNEKRRSGQLRRMTLDQLCWLLTGPEEKPTSVSAMYGYLALLEKLDLIVPRGDTMELPGARQVKDRKKRAATQVLRGWTVKDLPPSTYTGWRNAWDKLDAYRPDWRDNAPTPPTYVTTHDTDEDGRPTVEVREVREETGPRDGQEVFQKTGTPPTGPLTPDLFQKAGTLFQKAGTLVQKDGTDLALASKNSGPLRSLPNKPLSLETHAQQSPQRHHVEEREKKAATKKQTAGPQLPEQRAAEEQQTVAAAFVTALPGRLGSASARRLVPAVAAALAAGWTESTLRAELGRRVVVDRIQYAAAIPALYQRALEDLPAPPAPHSAAAALRCVHHPGRAAEYNDLCVECHSSKQAADPQMSAEDLAVGAAFRRQQRRNRARATT